jgi:alpha-galactosidase
MDVNARSLGLVERFARRLKEERGSSVTIRATTDLEEALIGADYVLVAISVGGDEMWRFDAVYPERYGIFQTIGDTVGPGGLMRALRHIPVLLDIGRIMQRVSTPDAVMIQLTNPMNPICAALAGLEGVRVLGVCHGAWDTEAIIARRLQVAKDDVHVRAAGNNHHIYLTELCVEERTYDGETLAEIAPQIFDKPFRAEVWRRYGGFVGNNTRHPIEFLPDFLTEDSDFGRTWGATPIVGWDDPFFDPRHETAAIELERAISHPEKVIWEWDHLPGTLRFTDEGRVRVRHSHEIIDDLIATLEYGGEMTLHLNVPNEGAIAGLSRNHNVEMPVSVRPDSLQRSEFVLPPGVTEQVRRVADEQLLVAEGAVKGDRSLLVDALSLDALVPDRRTAEMLVEEMGEHQRQYIPWWE